MLPGFSTNPTRFAKRLSLVSSLPVPAAWRLRLFTGVPDVNGELPQWDRPAWCESTICGLDERSAERLAAVFRNSTDHGVHLPEQSYSEQRCRAVSKTVGSESMTVQH